VALLFIVSPLVDVLTNVYPWGWGNEQWRFGFFGVTSNYLVSLIFGLLLAGMTAALAGHRGMLRATAVVAGLFAVVELVMCFGFVLDTIQVRMAVRPDQEHLFKIGAVKTAGKMGFCLIATACVSLGAFKALTPLKTTP
jgi:hypothetical protein